MVDSSVTVGCAVGIPAGVILIFVLVLWLRNQRMQKRQDAELKALDEEIRLDDALFADMEHELVAIRPPGAQIKDSGATNSASKELRPPFDEKLKLLAVEVTSDIQDTSSLLAADHTPSTGAVDSPAPKTTDQRSITTAASESVTAPTTPSQPRRQGHSHSNSNSTMTGQNQRTPSLYNFYDLVIPVMPQPGTVGVNAAAPLPKNNSSTSLGNAAPSLENLAKQLAQPSYFEKLPKGVAAPVNPRRLLPLSHQLLTADLAAEGDVPIGRILKGQFETSYRESSPFEEQAVIYK